MKKHILFILLLTPLISLPMNKVRYHTWFLLQKCVKTALFETQARVEFLTALTELIDNEEQDTVVLKNEDLVHKGMLVTGLTSVTTPTSAIFCTTIPSNSMACIDIYTDEMTFNKREVGEICRGHFGAHSHQLSYTIPDRDELPDIIKNTE